MPGIREYTPAIDKTVNIDTVGHARQKSFEISVVFSALFGAQQYSWNEKKLMCSVDDI